jgi:hypothetical protein
MVQELEDLTSPIAEFVRDWCKVGPGFSIGRSELYERFKEWSESKGKKHVDDITVFGRNLRAALPDLRCFQERDGERRTWKYDGLE